MLGEPENRFSLTRGALSGLSAQSKFLSLPIRGAEQPLRNLPRIQYA